MNFQKSDIRFYVLFVLFVLLLVQYISEIHITGGGNSIVEKNHSPALPMPNLNVLLEKRKPLAATGVNDDADNGHSDSVVYDGSCPTVAKETTDENVAKADTGPWRRILSMKSSGFHSFNATASDIIGAQRDYIQDTRYDECKKLTYDVCNLPRTSVIIVFHNEAWSTLLRSVHSVLDRTPNHLIVEIILIDDFSTFEWLHEPLQDYINHLPKVILIRLKSRQGLIKARLRGAREAKGEILYFTDAHTEVNIGWLQPLLARIVEDRKVVVVPYVDPISWRDMKYERVASHFHGAFDWNMEYFYKIIPSNVFNARKSIITDPIPSPTMIGCAHAVEKNYFFETGSYDENMEIWGGENIEHAFRIWMCGGRVEVLPCSKIGHVFKPNLPYSFGENSEMVIQRNMIRVAEVWMDDYKKYYYATQKRLSPIDIRSLYERKRLRNRLKCKSFDWYMKNIIPEMPIPPADAKWFGKIMVSTHWKYCIIKDFQKQMLKIVLCEPQVWKDLAFVITEKGYLRFNDQCIGVSDQSLDLSVSLVCDSNASIWEYNPKSHLIYILNTELCLRSNPKSGSVDLAQCWKQDKNQKWQFEVSLHFERQHNVLKNSVEHLQIPQDALRFGQLTNIQEQYCLHVLDFMKYEMVPCEDQPSYLHVVHLDTNRRLVYENICLTVANSNRLVFSKCDTINKSQELWHYHTDTLHLTANVNDSEPLCLTFNKNVQRNMFLADCDKKNLFQTWTI